MQPTIRATPIPKDIPRWLYELLRRVEAQGVSSQQQLGAVSRGESPVGGGTLIDLSDYLKLSGRPNQWAHGRNIFDVKPTAANTQPSSLQIGLGLRTKSSASAPTPSTQVEVNFSIEDNSSGKTLNQTREWIFPNFNEPEGQSVGFHIFADLSDYQTFTKKTIDNDCVILVSDATGATHSGFADETQTKILQLKIGGAMAANRNAASHAMTESCPVIQFPGMDVLTSGAAAKDRTHTLCVVKSPLSGGVHTGTPFEDSGFVHGGDARKELYSMPGSAKGTLAAPSQGSLPQFNPAFTLTGNFHLFAIDGIASNIVTNVLPNTTGLKAGMRIRQSTDSYSLPDDTFILSVDSASQVTMSANWPASPTTNTSIKIFGPNWITPLALSAGIDHGTLLGLTDDDHPQYLLLAGRAGGQVIGATAPTSGSTTDLALNGRFYLGTSTAEANAYLNMRTFSLKRDVSTADVTTGSGLIQAVSNQLLYLTGAGSYGTDTLFFSRQYIDGGSLATGGTLTLVGHGIMCSPVIPAGVSISLQGLLFQSTPTGAGTFSSIIGGEFQVSLSPILGATSTTTVGCLVSGSNRATVTTNFIGFRVQAFQGATITGAVTQATAFDVVGSWMNDTDVVTWSGLRISTGITAAIANKWSLDLTSVVANMGSRLSHPVAIGWTPGTVAAITSRLMLAAGGIAASSAPLKFQSGSLLTTPEAGAMEQHENGFYVTPTTTVTRNQLVTDLNVLFDEGALVTYDDVSYELVLLS